MRVAEFQARPSPHLCREYFGDAATETLPSNPAVWTPLGPCDAEELVCIGRTRHAACDRAIVRDVLRAVSESCHDQPNEGIDPVHRTTQVGDREHGGVCVGQVRELMGKHAAALLCGEIE